LRDTPRPREDVLRALPQLAEGLYVASVHWLYGAAGPGGTRFKHEVRDPPTSGRGLCYVLDRMVDERGKPVKMVTLFALCWFESYQVSRASLEYQSLAHPDAHQLRTGALTPAESDERLLSHAKQAFPSYWAQIMRYGWTQKDFDTAALIMRKLGLPVPLVERAEGEADRVSGGKEVSEAGLLKPVKRTSRKGQVLAFFWPETKSIREAMAEFGISRSNVLSQLYLLQKDHGIGYELKNDSAVITMPGGCADPWTE
jgi:hypothetical protein